MTFVAWRHEKGVDHAGPGGGGGNGGDVFVVGTRDIAGLGKYNFEKDFAAENGVTGLNKGMKGANGKDLTLDVPVGSVVKNLTTGEEFDILSEEPVLILSKVEGEVLAMNTSKAHEILRQKSLLQKWESMLLLTLSSNWWLTLVLLASNAGKSKVFSCFTNAKAKIGNYQFTTLSPNLGNLYGLIIADIPGLIEGASEGKGLGFKFLRHVLYSSASSLHDPSPRIVSKIMHSYVQNLKAIHQSSHKKRSISS